MMCAVFPRLCLVLYLIRHATSTALSLPVLGMVADSLTDERADCPCTPQTSRVMRAYRLCLIHKERASLSEESYKQRLRETPGHCQVGDVCITDWQAEALKQRCLDADGGEPSGPGSQRDIRTRAVKWPLVITYSISPGYPLSEQLSIQKAFALYSAKTCLSFNKALPNAEPNLKVSNGNGCSSYVGMVTRFGQTITLQTNSHCLMTGTILHEIGHALGLIHEHVRPDRDDHITVMFSNIREGIELIDFSKEESALLTGPYDYESMMHYGKNAGAMSDKYVLVPKDAQHLNTIGQHAGLSFNDLKSINNRYCSHTCTSSNISCEHLGYPDPTDCSRCHCQYFFSGITCDQLRPHSNVAKCQGSQYITLSNSASSHTLSISPYSNADLICIWEIQAPIGYIVVIDTIGSSYLIGESPICVAHWLEVRDAAASDLLGRRFCGIDHPVNFCSDTRTLIVMFSVTKYASFKSSNFNGFSLQFSAELGTPKCVMPTFVRNNTENNIGYKRIWNVGETVTYTCTAGLHLEAGHTELFLTCMKVNGVALWSTKSASCSAIMCGPLLSNLVSNATLFTTNSSAESALGTSAWFQCFNGFSIASGNSEVKATCSSVNAAGAWTHEGHCRVIMCDQLGPNVTSITSVNKTKFSLGSTLLYRCSNGYGTTSDFGSAKLNATCTSVNGIGVWMHEEHCLDVDECAATTAPCRDGSLCVNTIGSYTCPCVGNSGPATGIQLTAAFTESYEHVYGSLSPDVQKYFRRSVEEELTRIYNRGRTNSTEAVYICQFRIGSTVVDHVAVLYGNLSDADKGIYAYAAHQALNTASPLLISWTRLTLKEPLGLTTKHGIEPITSECSYFNSMGKCQGGTECTTSPAGTPNCECPAATSGDPCQKSDNKVVDMGLVIGLAIGISTTVIIIIIIISIIGVFIMKRKNRVAPKSFLDLQEGDTGGSVG